MAGDDRDILEILEFELKFLEDGSYGRSLHAPAFQPRVRMTATRAESGPALPKNPLQTPSMRRRTYASPDDKSNSSSSADH